MGLNNISPSMTTSSVLIADERTVSPGGSNDGIAQMTRDINNDPVSAALEIQSTLGGVLFPRMTTAEMNDIEVPYDGMMIYNTTAASFYGYSGGLWAAIAGGGGGGAPTTATYITKTDQTGVLPNSQPLSLLSTGLLKSTTGTGVISTAVAGTDYALPASVPPIGATYITQTPDGTLSNEQPLSLLSTGILKSTTGTGVVSTAVAGTDYVVPSALTPIFSAPYITKTDITATFANSQPLSALTTGLLKSTTGTGVVSIAVAGVDYALPGGGGAPTTATYITQTPDGALSNEQPLSLLSTGILKSTTGTGVVSTAVAGTDYYSPGFPTFIYDTNPISDNLFIGTGTSTNLANAASVANVGIGTRALASITNLVATAIANTAVGYEALNANTGESNTAVGTNALSDNVGGNNNTAVGRDACAFSTNTQNVCAFGAFSLRNVTASNASAFGVESMKNGPVSTDDLAAFGHQSMLNQAGGSGENSAFGSRTLSANVSTGQNTAIGALSLLNHATGNQNTAVGAQTSSTITSQSACTYIGFFASASAEGLTNATAIGAFSTVGTSDTLVLGSGNAVEMKGTLIGSFTGTQVIRKQQGVLLNPGSSSTIDFPVPTSSPRRCVSVTATINFISQNGTTCAGSFAPTTMSAFYNGATTTGITPPTITIASIGTTTGAAAAWSVSGNNIRLTITGVSAVSTTWMVTTEQFAVTTTDL